MRNWTRYMPTHSTKDRKGLKEMVHDVGADIKREIERELKRRKKNKNLA